MRLQLAAAALLLEDMLKPSVHLDYAFHTYVITTNDSKKPSRLAALSLKDWDEDVQMTCLLSQMNGWTFVDSRRGSWTAAKSTVTRINMQRKDRDQ